MKRLILLLFLIFTLKGCLTAVAGFNDGSSGSGPVSDAWNWIKKSSIEYNETMKSEIHDCLFYTNKMPGQCTKNVYVRSCDTSEFNMLQLRYNCKIKKDEPVYNYYVRIETKDNRKFNDYSVFKKQ